MSFKNDIFIQAQKSFTKSEIHDLVIKIFTRIYNKTQDEGIPYNITLDHDEAIEAITNYINSKQSKYTFNDMWNRLDRENKLDVAIDAINDTHLLSTPNSDKWTEIIEMLEEAKAPNTMKAVAQLSFTVEYTGKGMSEDDFREAILNCDAVELVNGSYLGDLSDFDADQTYIEGYVDDVEITTEYE